MSDLLFCIDPRVGYLTANVDDVGGDEVALTGDGCGILDLSAFERALPPLRGEDRVMPGAVGRRANRRRIDEAVQDLRLVVTGLKDIETGAPATDEEATLTANIAYLVAQVIDPPAPPLKNRPFSMTKPGWVTPRTANAIVTAFEPEVSKPDLLIAHLELTVARGRFT